MNCREFREQLGAALDERRVVSVQRDSAGIAEVGAHAESCADCRSLYEEHLLIETALAAWKPRRPVVDLTERVIETAHQEGLVASASASSGEETVVVQESTSKIPPGRNVWATVVTVALVLVAVAIVIREKPGAVVKQDKPPQPLFPDENQQESQDQLADIGHLVADAQSAFRGITTRVSHQASGFSVFVPDLKDDLGISGVADSLETTPDSSSTDTDSDPRSSSEPSAVEKAFEFLFDDGAGGTQTI